MARSRIRIRCHDGNLPDAAYELLRTHKAHGGRGIEVLIQRMIHVWPRQLDDTAFIHLVTQCNRLTRTMKALEVQVACLPDSLLGTHIAKLQAERHIDKTQAFRVMLAHLATMSGLELAAPVVGQQPAAPRAIGDKHPEEQANRPDEKLVTVASEPKHAPMTKGMSMSMNFLAGLQDQAGGRP